MTEIKEIFSREKENLNIHEYAFIKPSVVIFSDEVRMFCEKNNCGMYGTSWACPPAIESIEECKKMCGSFENAFIFTTVTKLKKKYDTAEWLKSRKVHEAITDKKDAASVKNVLILKSPADFLIVCTLRPKVLELWLFN